MFFGGLARRAGTGTGSGARTACVGAVEAEPVGVAVGEAAGAEGTDTGGA